MIHGHPGWRGIVDRNSETSGAVVINHHMPEEHHSR